MKRILYISRFISWIAIICSLLGSFLLFFAGAKKTYYAYTAIIFSDVPKDSLSHLDSSEIATHYLIKSLDTFLIAFVLFIFAHGVFTLFISNKPILNKTPVLNWIRTPNIKHLKIVLAEVIVIILFVKFLEVILVNSQNLTWQVLVLPISILLLSLGLKLLGSGDESKKSESSNTNSDEL